MDADRWERKRERWERRRQWRRRDPVGQAFTGIILVVIGAVFLLGNMGYLEVRYVFRNFWPLVLIFIGLKILIFNRDYRHGGQGFGLIWLILGGFLLLSNFNFINVAFRTIWPFVPMAIGALILWKVFVDRDDATVAGPADADSNSGSTIYANAAMAHISRKSNAQEFKGGNVSTFMGMCEVDLRGASPAGGEAVLDVSAIMGGIEIRIPADWTIVNRVSAFLGDLEDKTDPPKDTAKRLVLRGSVFMGGVEVRN